MKAIFDMEVRDRRTINKTNLADNQQIETIIKFLGIPIIRRNTDFDADISTKDNSDYVPGKIRGFGK